MNGMKVGAVIITMGNRPDELRALLDSIAKQDGDLIEAVVVGNGSPVPDVPEGVRTVELPENLGIPGGRNVGIEAFGPSGRDELIRWVGAKASVAAAAYAPVGRCGAGHDGFDPVTRGDPMSPLRWTSKSIRSLTGALREKGHRVSDSVTRRLLKERGYSLQANAKTIEGAQHHDRDAQFRYLNEQARDHRDAGDPVISVDSKKKELIGDYRNAGHEWQPAGQPVRVKTHDFPGQAEKAIPYGIYDMTANTGWVSIGTDHDTAAFAVAFAASDVTRRRSLARADGHVL